MPPSSPGRSAPSGGVRDRRWLAAVERVPRHLFVPRWYERDGTGWIAVGIVEPDSPRAQQRGYPVGRRRTGPDRQRISGSGTVADPADRAGTGCADRGAADPAADLADGAIGRRSHPPLAGPPVDADPSARTDPAAVADPRPPRTRPPGPSGPADPAAAGRRAPRRPGATDGPAPTTSRIPASSPTRGSRAPTATTRSSPRSCPTATAAAPRSPRRRSPR